MDSAKNKTGNTQFRGARIRSEEYQESHKDEIAVVLGQFLIKCLRKTYQDFEGDLIIPIVLGEIALYNIAPPGTGSASKPRVSPAHLKAMRPCNALSLSQTTGIPRETVRRKITRLVKQGLVKRTSKGIVKLTPAAEKLLSVRYNSDLLRDLLETSDRIRKMLAREPGNPPAKQKSA